MTAAPPQPLPAGDADEVAELPTPLPELPEPSAAARAVLRTAAAPRIDPDPIVTLGGQDLTTTAAGPGPIVLDDLSVTWGRGEALEQAGPATAAVTLLDIAGGWATGRELIGQTLNLSWSATYPGETQPRRKVFFRGRITAVGLSKRSVSNTDAPATVVELGASSLLNDLANRVPFEDWPDETLGARRARIAAQVVGPVATLTTRAFWDTPHAAPVAAPDQPALLDSLTALFDSAGPDRMTYNPDTQAVDWLNRRNYSSSGLGYLWWKVPGEGTTRDGLGAYAATRPLGSNADNKATSRHYLDAADLQADEELLGKDITSRITRIEVAHKDSGAAFADRVETSLVVGTVEAAQGVRAVRHDSQITWNSWAQVAADDLAGMAGAEGAGWRIGSLTFRADLAGGFEYVDQFAEILLAGVEANSPLFFQRAWFTALGIRPLLWVIGGTITYAGGWRVGIDVLPIGTRDPQHAISWSEIDDGSATYQLEWHDDDHPRGLHETLTYEDIGFVARGLGVTTAPTNAEWDQVYSL